MQLPALTLLLVSVPLISAAYGRVGYVVSDCDGVTNKNTYYGTPATIDGPTCVAWPDGNFEITEISSDADGFDCQMVVYADPACQVDPTVYPGGCYANTQSFAIWCSLKAPPPPPPQELKV